MNDDSPLFAQVRTDQIARVSHEFQSRNHILNVAFNNRVIASEKWLAGKLLRLPLGQIVARTLYFPAGSDVKGWSIGRSDFLKIELRPAAILNAREQADGLRCLALRPATPLDDPVIWHLACIIRADFQSGRPGGNLLHEQVQNLLAHHLSVAPLSPANSAAAGNLAKCALTPARLRAVRDYISSRLEGEIRLVELASVAKLSIYHFARAFKVCTGMSPYQYVLEQRLSTARRLLEGTGLSITDISVAAGFATHTGFAAAFRRKLGVSPSRYRRLAGIEH